MGEHKTSRLPRTASLFIAVATFTALPQAVRATAITWDAGGGADEHWSTAANWNNSDTIPAGTGDTASLNGAGKNATYDSSVLVANQTVGSVTVANQVDFGTLTIASGSLTIQDNFFVGGFHTGTVNQTGGSVVVQSVGGRFKLAASDPASSGSAYNLSGGTFETRSDTFIGNLGGATFTQTGGTWTSNAAAGTQMRIGFANGISGSYEVAGGVSTQQVITIAAASSYSIGGSGQLNVDGGTLTADKIQKGSASTTGTTAFFDMFGGAVNVGDLEIKPDFFESSPAATPVTLNATTVGVNISMGRSAVPANKSRLAPGGLGAIGTTTFATGTTLTENNAACILAFDISGATSDQVLMDLTTGSAVLNGFLDINVLAGATLPYYDVLSAGSITGALTLTDPSRFSYAIVPGPGSSEILRVFVPEPGTAGLFVVACAIAGVKRTRRLPTL